MKNIYALGILLIIVICSSWLGACKKPRLGTCSMPVSFTPVNAELSANADSIDIITSERNWWLNELMWNGQNAMDSTINTSEKNFIIAYNDFVFERIDGNKIRIKCFQNTTGIENNLLINVQAGNCFSGLQIKQKAN